MELDVNLDLDGDSDRIDIDDIMMCLDDVSDFSQP
jgi:hypothetical protein